MEKAMVSLMRTLLENFSLRRIKVSYCSATLDLQIYSEVMWALYDGGEDEAALNVYGKRTDTFT